MDEATFMAEVEALTVRDQRLTPVEAAVLAAIGLGVAADSRTFSKIFGISHAIALRAVADLTDGYGLVVETARDLRTQRARLALTDAGLRLFDAAPHPVAA